MRPFLFSAAVVLALVAPAHAAEQRFTSGPHRVSLIELYTSEGCSSCPPAERWLGSLREAPGLWRDFVPVALHVNYWDRLGWPDRFATREFTQREHAYASQWNSNSVYTPCFVRDGAEWRAEKSAPNASTEKAGELSAKLTDDGRVHVAFSSADSPRQLERYEVHVAVLGSDLSSKVTAGENRGETLRHEFVALAIDSRPLTKRSGSAHEAEFALPQTKITDAPRRALAVWVTRQGELSAIQATGGWLPR